MPKPEKLSHNQMRILRLRYDELNRETGKLMLKADMTAYINSLRRLVDRALKNSGFYKTPVYVDRVARRKVEVDKIANKGNVLRR